MTRARRTGPGIEGTLLGTCTSACGHAPRLPVPVTDVGARVALDSAPDHQQQRAEHSGDARLAVVGCEVVVVG